MVPKRDYEFISLIKRLYTLLMQNIDLALKPYGLARTQYLVLYHAQAPDGVPTKQLLEKLRVEGATLSGIIDTLVTKGFVARQEQPDDKRRKNVVLTEAGRTLLQKIPPPGPALEQAIVDGLTEDDAAQMKTTATHIVHNLETNLQKTIDSKGGHDGK